MSNILIVDDEPDLLDFFCEELEDVGFNVQPASNGNEGLQAITQTTFSVVLSDMRMPGMNGIEFLTAVKAHKPDTVRMMLTGNADLETAIQAMNEGNVFRFLTKPCPIDSLVNTLTMGVEQYRLITAEQELLQKTLKGSVKVLVDILSFVNAAAFSRASRLRRIISDILTELSLADSWQFELAAMLSQIGCVTLSAEIIDKYYRQSGLSVDEQRMFFAHPAIGSQLLVQIPRLELISRMIEGQQNPEGLHISPDNLSTEDNIANFGAQLLKLAHDFDEQIARGVTSRAALTIIRKRPGLYNPHLLTALSACYSTPPAEVTTTFATASVGQLQIGAIFEQDVLAQNGLLLAQKGQEVTPLLLARLHNFARGVGVVEPFRVQTVDQPKD